MTRSAKTKPEPAETRQALADFDAEEGSAPEPTPTPKAKNSAPSFGISEGTRDQLEREGQAVCPFTGRLLTKADL